MSNSTGGVLKTVLSEAIRAEIVALFKQGVSVSVIATEVARNQHTIYSWLYRQPEFLKWRKKYRKPRRADIVANRINGKQVLHPPDMESEPQPCPKCFHMVYLPAQPFTPCYACQLRDAEEGAVTI